MTFYRCTGGGGEVHGAKIEVSCNDASIIGSICRLYFGEELIASAVFSESQIAFFDDIQQVGTYTAKAILGERESETLIDITADSIIYGDTVQAIVGFNFIYYDGDEFTDVTGGWRFPNTVYSYAGFGFDNNYGAWNGHSGVRGTVTRQKNTDSITIGMECLNSNLPANYYPEYEDDETYTAAYWGNSYYYGLFSIYSCNPIDFTNIDKITMFLDVILDKGSTPLSNYAYSKSDFVVSLFSKIPTSDSVTGGIGSGKRAAYYDISVTANIIAPDAVKYTTLTNGRMIVEFDTKSIIGNHYISCQLVDYFRTDGANGKTGGIFNLVNTVNIKRIMIN